MINVKVKITQEEFDKAQKKGAYSIVSESILMGYGCYNARVFEEDGEYYLSYSRGDSCD